MKHFRDVVRRRMERDGWHVYPVTFRNRPIVDLLCYRNGMVKLIKAKAHGHIYQKERKALCLSCNSTKQAKMDMELIQTWANEY